MTKAALDAAFSLALLAVRDGVPIEDAARSLLVHANGERVFSKRAEDGSGGAGQHGIPEIGYLEQAYYNSLTSGQKDAVATIKELIDDIWGNAADAWKMDFAVDQWKRDAFQRLATHPMQAYLLGQMLASNKMNKPIERPLLPTDKRAIDFLEQYAFSEIDSSFDALKGNLRAQLLDSQMKGENPKEAARKLANSLHDYNTQWDAIAITETARAESSGRLQEFADANVDRCIGSSAHDARVCQNCLDKIDGKVYKVSDVQGVSNFGVPQAAWKPCIPLHPRCRCVWLPYEEGTKEALGL